MVTVQAAPIRFGEGVYSFPVAAKLLPGASTRQLRYWMKTGLTPPSRPRADATQASSDVLSFHDLVSLEIVRRITTEGVSLQKVRTFEAQLRSLRPEASRPFALDVFWTDGVDVWIELEPGDRRLVQGTGKDRSQLAWREAIRLFADEVRYEDGAATVWNPAPEVTLDPRVQFGEPVIEGTRVTVQTIVRHLTVASPAEVASWYDLREDQVRAAETYAAARR